MKIRCIILLMIIAAWGTQAMAQITVKGTVYDSLGRYPVPYVSVMTTNGSGTATNIDGNYSISMNPGDSIWFSYLNKPTRKFGLQEIQAPYAFNISLKTFIDLLPEVKIRQRNYKLDSIENREVYAKIFDYQKPGLSVVSGNGGIGFDLTEIINAFRFKRNRRLQSFQNRLLLEEKDKFVKNRFSKGLVRRLTLIEDDNILNDFMIAYQPSYFFTSRASDYNFHKYIKDSYERYKKQVSPSPLWREGFGNDDFSVEPEEEH